MKLHFLMIGFISKPSYVQAALQTGARISLLISQDKYHRELEQVFYKVWTVKDIYNWLEIKAVLDQSEKIDAILTRYENYVSVLGAANQYLGLEGIDYLKARAFCNKYLMKQKWQQAAVPCAAGISLDDLSNLDNFLATHHFPLILKSAASVHSNFVFCVRSKKELLDKLKTLQNNREHVISKPVKNFTNKTNSDCQFLLEEMLSGRELTVDTFVSRERFTHTPICEYVMSHTLAIKDSYLPIRTMPTTLNSDQEKLVYSTVEQALIALGAKNCVCHTEVFFDEQKNKCFVIESTPRSGGNRAEMTSISTGYDYDLAVFRAAANLPIPKLPKVKQAISVVEYFAERSGILKSSDFSFLEQESAVSHIKIRNLTGSMVRQAKFGGKTLVNFYVVAKNQQQSQNLAIHLFQQLRKKVRINSV